MEENYEERWPEDRGTWPQIIADLAKRFLDIKRWEFREIPKARLSKRHAMVIYNSKWCRLQLMLLDRRRFGGHETISIAYGRSHAPDDEDIMIWNGQRCLCWHYIDETALYFLDGLSPKQATEVRTPKVIEQFWESDFVKNITYSPERTLRLHAAIWKHYGQRLFELFDLRRPDLWEQYSQFVREFYEINGEAADPIYNPPVYRIC